MREAVHRPTWVGVLDTEIWNSLALILDSPAIFGCLHPPIVPPQGPCTFRRADPKLLVCWPMFASKNASKISIDFWKHFGNQKESTSLPKSIQNRFENLQKTMIDFSIVFLQEFEAKMHPNNKEKSMKKKQ